MKQNMGTLDRIVRTIAAVIIAVLYFTHVISGMLAIILLIVGLAFILTSSISFCTIYRVFNISTKKEEQQ